MLRRKRCSTPGKPSLLVIWGKPSSDLYFQKRNILFRRMESVILSHAWTERNLSSFPSIETVQREIIPVLCLWGFVQNRLSHSCLVSFLSENNPKISFSCFPTSDSLQSWVLTRASVGREIQNASLGSVLHPGGCGRRILLLGLNI